MKRTHLQCAPALFAMTCFKFLALALSLLLPGASLQAADTCNLDRAVYRDTENRGFTLAFSAPPPDSAALIARARLSHKTRGKLFDFEVVQSNGYGTISLVQPDDTSRSHEAYFFGADLKPTFSAGSALMFVNGLGARDYYANREKHAAREALLGDTVVSQIDIQGRAGYEIHSKVVQT